MAGEARIAGRPGGPRTRRSRANGGTPGSRGDGGAGGRGASRRLPGGTAVASGRRAVVPGCGQGAANDGRNGAVAGVQGPPTLDEGAVAGTAELVETKP